MNPFLVKINAPYIGQHGWTAWCQHSLILVLGCISSQEVEEKIVPYLPPEDPEVKKQLLLQDKREKYYDIKITPLLGENGIFKIPAGAI